MNTMKIIQVNKLDNVDYREFVKRTALEKDFTTLIKEPCILMEGEKVLLIYNIVDIDTDSVVKDLKSLKYHEGKRTRGLVSTSRIFGFRPRSPNAIENGYDLIFKIDDDIKCFTDFRKRTTPKGTAEILEDFIHTEVLDNFSQHALLGAIAFPYSFHMFTEETWKPTKKLQTCYIVRTEFLTNDTYDFTVFEDFAVALDILVHGSKVMKYGMIGQELGIQVGKGTGGFQDFSRLELAQKDAENLRKLYPPLNFKKVNKSWGIEPDMRSIKL